MITKKPLTGRCAACDKPIVIGWLMCPQHWHSVPRELQFEVNSSWNRVRRVPRRDAETYLKALRAYRVAREAAVASITSVPADGGPTA